MARHFPDFLSAYIDYASNEYAPEQFTRWTGLSVLAGALERKVWLPEGNYCNYPNLFVLLTSGPGIGKSSAIRQGVPLLYGIQKDFNTNFKIQEGVTTAAGLREIMTLLDNMPGGAINQFSSVFCVGREGSDSALKNHGGDDYRSMSCNMYDCEDLYQFTLKTGVMNIPQPVMNMLVGATFDFLGSVIDQNSVFGGLASRFTYVVEKNNTLAGEFFGDVIIDDGDVDWKTKLAETGDVKMKQLLIEDLGQIHRLYGAMRVKKDVLPIVKKWFDDFKEEFNGMESERMKSLFIRKRTLLKKILILVAISEGNDFVVKPHHAEVAVKLVDEVTKDNPYILSQSAIVNLEDQRGTTQYIAQLIKRKGNKTTRKSICASALSHGNDTKRVNETLDFMVGAGWIKLGDNGIVELMVDPDRHL